jgi:hypothetical protein
LTQADRSGRRPLPWETIPKHWTTNSSEYVQCFRETKETHWELGFEQEIFRNAWTNNRNGNLPTIGISNNWWTFGSRWQLRDNPKNAISVFHSWNGLLIVQSDYRIVGKRRPSNKSSIGINTSFVSKVATDFRKIPLQHRPR